MHDCVCMHVHVQGTLPPAAVATLVVHADEAEDCGEFFVRLDAPGPAPPIAD